MRLWYRQPAQQWVEALAIGNGRMGGMVFGGVSRERIALNEDTLWSGYPRETAVPGGARHVQKARDLMDAGDLAGAEAYIQAHLTGPYTQAYEPLGDLTLSFPGLEEATADYTRALSLDEAVATTTFVSGGVRHRRTYYVSAPDQALVAQLSVDVPGALNLDAGLDSPLRHRVTAEASALWMHLRAPSVSEPNYKRHPEPIAYADDPARQGMRAAAVLEAAHRGGSLTWDETGLHLRGADSVTLVLCCRTSFAGFGRHPELAGLDEVALCRQDLARLPEGLCEGTLRARHGADHAALFARTTLTLAGDDRDDLPTDVRLKAFYDDPTQDVGLVTLLFQFGRYLLIACSRPGTQAATLQGIWNQEVCPPWSSNYTININTQMNYWPAEVCNLSELHEPLFDLVDRLRVTGSRVARDMFDARGAVAGHNADLWGQAAPVGEGLDGCVGYGWWPMGYAWLATHLYDHFVYTGDADFLRDRALPAFRDAAVFFADTLTVGSDGVGRFYPATSPENAYTVGEGSFVIARQTTMTLALIRETFEHYLDALAVLGITEPEATAVRAALVHLPPYPVGPDGRLLEWDAPYDEPEPDHRHVSHLLALYPGRSIHAEETPALAQACRASLEKRGDDGTGWSLGWKVGLWAHLRDGDRALKLIRRQLRPVITGATSYGPGGGTYPNLFDAHPPFQIDGNFGVTAGIAHLFVQAWRDTVRLLPALPSTWQTGAVRGLRGANGCIIDCSFCDGALTDATVHGGAATPQRVTVCYGEYRRTLTLAPGETIRLDGSLGLALS